MSGSNPNSQTRVIYKPDSQSTEEFMVIVNPEEVSVGYFLLIGRLNGCFQSIRNGVKEVSQNALIYGCLLMIS